MKSKTKIITIILILAATMGILSGCTKTIDNSEGVELIANAVQNSLARNSYFVKYLNKASNTVNYINYQEDKSAMLAQFGHTDKANDKYVSDRTLFYYGTSLETKVIDAATIKEVLPLTEVHAKYEEIRLATILADITNLTANDISYDIKGSGIWTKGKVTFIVLKITNPNNRLSAYDGIEINLLYDKVNLVRSLDETMRLDVTYQGPVIKP